MKSLSKNVLIHVLSKPPFSTLGAWIFGIGIPIFTIHRIVSERLSENDITPEYLRKCLSYLKHNGYSFVSVEDIAAYLRREKDLPHKPVAFTMDDGFYDQANLAGPLFAEFNCPATIFLISGMLDGELWPWFAKVDFLINNSKRESINFQSLGKSLAFSLNHKNNKSHASRIIRGHMKSIDTELISELLKHIEAETHVSIPELPPSEFKPMTWDMARESEKLGMKFGPHTVSHPILSNSTEKDAAYEITKSWQRIKDELSSPSPIFCYPNGKSSDFGEREIDIIKSCGLLGAVTTEPDYSNENRSLDKILYEIPRFSISASYIDFIQVVTWIERSKSKLNKFYSTVTQNNT